jgi:hypothetical protein
VEPGSIQVDLDPNFAGEMAVAIFGPSATTEDKLACLVALSSIDAALALVERVRPGWS